jgi:hypothetical protein
MTTVGVIVDVNEMPGMDDGATGVERDRAEFIAESVSVGICGVLMVSTRVGGGGGVCVGVVVIQLLRSTQPSKTINT